MSISITLKLFRYNLIYFYFRCDFNKYTIRVIKKMYQAKINEAKDTEINDEEMLLITNDTENANDSDELMSNDTSEEYLVLNVQ